MRAGRSLRDANRTGVEVSAEQGRQDEAPPRVETSDDGVVTWNGLDEQLKDAKAYPILRKR